MPYGITKLKGYSIPLSTLCVYYLPKGSESFLHHILNWMNLLGIYVVRPNVSVARLSIILGYFGSLEFQDKRQKPPIKAAIYGTSSVRKGK
jgi:hypothetical protein